VVADGVDGRLVPVDDPAALAVALASVALVAPPAAAAEGHRPPAIIAAHALAYGLPTPVPTDTPQERSR
jgi:alpha/beta superfamily hydrolase